MKSLLGLFFLCGDFSLGLVSCFLGLFALLFGVLLLLFALLLGFLLLLFGFLFGFLLLLFSFFGGLLLLSLFGSGFFGSGFLGSGFLGSGLLGSGLLLLGIFSSGSGSSFFGSDFLFLSLLFLGFFSSGSGSVGCRGGRLWLLGSRLRGHSLSDGLVDVRDHVGTKSDGLRGSSFVGFGCLELLLSSCSLSGVLLGCGGLLLHLLGLLLGCGGFLFLRLVVASLVLLLSSLSGILGSLLGLAIRL